MSKRKSFEEATDSLLAAFTNAGGDSVNSNKGGRKKIFAWKKL
jgi:hypothetical protein